MCSLINLLSSSTLQIFCTGKGTGKREAGDEEVQLDATADHSQHTLTANTPIVLT